MSDVFREVDEELRQEQLKKLWQRYRFLIIGVVLMVVLGVGGYQAWQAWQQSQRTEASDSFAQALEKVRRGDVEGGLADLQAQADPEAGSFGTLASFAEARVLFGDGRKEEAVARWDALAASDAGGPTFRAIALLLSVMHQVDTGDPAALAQRLTPLLAEGHPFRPSALELSALLSLKAGDQAAARETLAALLQDPAAPAGLQARAQQLLAAIGG